MGLRLVSEKPGIVSCRLEFYIVSYGTLTFCLLPAVPSASLCSYVRCTELDTTLNTLLATAVLLMWQSFISHFSQDLSYGSFSGAEKIAQNHECRGDYEGDGEIAGHYEAAQARP